MREELIVSARALFLDRDGTLVEPRHFPSRPEELVLYEGIDEHLRALQATGLRIIVVTNQSGVARGYVTRDDLAHMHGHLRAALADLGVALDAIYVCPHHPQGVVPELTFACACRKPQPGLLFEAAADFDLDLSRSWFVGDILDDVEAGRRAGCRTVLVDLGTEAPPTDPLRRPDFVARDTRHVLRLIRSLEGIGPDTDLSYRPPSWDRADFRHGAGQTDDWNANDQLGVEVP